MSKITTTSPPLTFCVLTHDPSNYSNQRLLSAAQGRGHALIFLKTRRVYMNINADQTALYYQNMPLIDHIQSVTQNSPTPYAIIPRIGAQMTQYGTRLVRQFEQNGIFTLTPSHAIAVAADKFHAHQIMAAHNIPTPPTAFAMAGRDQPHAIDLVGGAPVVIKLLSGTGGKGVMLAQTKSQALAIMGGYNALYADIMVQAYIPESKGSDIRAFVIGDTVVGAIQRTAKSGEFRSNLHLGGTAIPVTLTDQETLLVVKTARALGLTVAGIDLLRAKDGPLILEANASPGLEGIEATTGKDIAALIISALEQKIAP